MKKCGNCPKPVKRGRNKFCSLSCARRARWNKPGERIKQSNKNRERFAAKRPATHQASVERHKLSPDRRKRNFFLIHTYGITLDEWEALFEKQGRACGICGTTSPKGRIKWHTDHDHATKKIRGILCHQCNSGIGMLSDDISLLSKAAAYLGVHQGVLSGDAIERAEAISPFVPRTSRSGLTYGKSMAGYDITLDQDIELTPKQFALGSSAEYFNIPLDCVMMLFDKSTLARRGLSLFNTVAEPGWRGYLTIELFNAGNETLQLKRGDPIAQCLFVALDQPAGKGYDGKYQDQRRGPKGPK